MQSPSRGNPSPTRREILRLLCGSPHAARELAEKLLITATAVRAHLQHLEEDGLVRYEVVRRGVGKPAHEYQVTSEGEAVVSRAYLPLAEGMLAALESEQSSAVVAHVLRTAGRSVATRRRKPTGRLRQPAEAALDLLAELGGVGHVEKDDGRVVIRSTCCPIGGVVVDHPIACKAMEAMLQEASGAPVAAECVRGDRPSCRFLIGTA